MIMRTFEAFRGHAHSEAPLECCGLIVRALGEERYLPGRNVSETPEEAFRIHEDDWIEAEKAGEVVAICHSHPGENADPSGGDMEGVIASGVPWFILGEGDELQRVDASIPDLLGRVFDYGWSDCYTLVRDWFAVTRDVRLPDFPREDDFWEAGRSPYIDHFREFGFEEVEDLMPGDALLMRIGQSKVPNHAAIYTGGGRILHHMQDRLSSSDIYDGRFQRATTHRLRLK